MTRFRSLTAVLLLATLGACSDATAPEPKTDELGYLTISAATFSNTVVDFNRLYPEASRFKPAITLKGDTAIQRFKVDPEDGAVVEFGSNSGHFIAIPANTICDPKRTLYGPTEWLKTCTLAEDDITFEVKTWKGANGRPNVTFKPDVRFSPKSLLPVTLYFKDTALLDFTRVYIPYCRGTTCVDEGRTDLLLKTYAARTTTTGYWVFRALRHFSGYNVTAD